MELFSEYEKPKEKTVYQRCIDLWLLSHPGWSFGSIHGRKMKSIIKKIINFCKFRGLEGTSDQQVASFEKMMIWIMQNDYYQNEDLSTIDSHFNKIVSQILQGKQNGKGNWHSKNSADRFSDFAR